MKAITWEIHCRRKISSKVDVTHTQTHVANMNKEELAIL